MTVPNRIVREQIKTSDAFNRKLIKACGWAQAELYRRLINNADDFGRFDARPGIVRTECFPLLLDIVREGDVSRWLKDCAKAGLVALYEYDSKPFGVLFKTDRPRALSAKHPQPPEGIVCWRGVGGKQGTTEVTGAVRADDCVCAQTRPYSYSLTESYSNAQRARAQGGSRGDSADTPRAPRSPPSKNGNRSSTDHADSATEISGQALRRIKSKEANRERI